MLWNQHFLYPHKNSKIEQHFACAIGQIPETKEWDVPPGLSGKSAGNRGHLSSLLLTLRFWANDPSLRFYTCKMKPQSSQIQSFMPSTPTDHIPCTTFLFSVQRQEGFYSFLTHLQVSKTAPLPWNNLSPVLAQLPLMLYLDLKYLSLGSSPSTPEQCRSL